MKDTCDDGDPLWNPSDSVTRRSRLYAWGHTNPISTRLPTVRTLVMHEIESCTRSRGGSCMDSERPEGCTVSESRGAKCITYRAPVATTTSGFVRGSWGVSRGAVRGACMVVGTATSCDCSPETLDTCSLECPWGGANGANRIALCIMRGGNLPGSRGSRAVCAAATSALYACIGEARYSGRGVRSAALRVGGSMACMHVAHASCTARNHNHAMSWKPTNHSISQQSTAHHSTGSACHGTGQQETERCEEMRTSEYPKTMDRGMTTAPVATVPTATTADTGSAHSGRLPIARAHDCTASAGNVRTTSTGCREGWKGAGHTEAVSLHCQAHHLKKSAGGA